MAADTCAQGHPWTPASTYWRGPWRSCRTCSANAIRARFDEKHAGHCVIDTPRLTPNGVPYRRCLTCAPARRRSPRPSDVDEVAVVRAVAGDPPPRLLPAERRAAILQLRPALPVPVIAEVVRCSQRTVERHLAAARNAP